VEPQRGWPEYLDALETYLQKVSQLLCSKSISTVPSLVASQPGGPVPAEEERRAAVLLARTRRMEVSVGDWVEEVLSSKRSIDVRRRVEPGRCTGRIESVL
jgi:hypothetical protein